MNEQILERIAKLEAEIAALKAEAEKPAPKFKVGDRAYIPVEVIRMPGEIVDEKYIVLHKNSSLHWPINESDLLPAAPALVPVVPGELKPGDEVYVKASVNEVYDDGDIEINTKFTGSGGAVFTDNAESIPANVYQVR